MFPEIFIIKVVQTLWRLANEEANDDESILVDFVKKKIEYRRPEDHSFVEWTYIVGVEA